MLVGRLRRIVALDGPGASEAVAMRMGGSPLLLVGAMVALAALDFLGAAGPGAVTAGGVLRPQPARPAAGRRGPGRRRAGGPLPARDPGARPRRGDRP